MQLAAADLWDMSHGAHALLLRSGARPRAGPASGRVAHGQAGVRAALSWGSRAARRRLLALGRLSAGRPWRPAARDAADRLQGPAFTARLQRQVPVWQGHRDVRVPVWGEQPWARRAFAPGEPTSAAVRVGCHGPPRCGAPYRPGGCHEESTFYAKFRSPAGRSHGLCDGAAT